MCYFSVLVCCRSLVQIRVQKGLIKQKLKSWPLTVRSSALRSSARGTTECRRVDLRFTSHPSRSYAPSLQHLHHRNSKAVICNRSQLVRSNAVRSNATPTIECTRRCDRTHVIGSNTCRTAINRTTCDRAHPWLGSTLNFVYK